MRRCNIARNRETTQQLDSLLVIVLGASGDLAKKKIFPALYELWEKEVMPRSTVVCGFGRSHLNDSSLRAVIRPFIVEHMGMEYSSSIDSFLSSCFYCMGSAYDDSETLSKILDQHYAHHRDSLLVYLAVPPHVFQDATRALKLSLENRTKRCTGFVRIILEKPFGQDYESCKKMQGDLLKQGWDERKLYRIDHYLGKEMVRSILPLRRQNAWMQQLWSKNAIQSIHVLWKESIGTDGRGGYFDGYGIIRDIVQNHLIQLLLLVSMELPDKLTSTAIEDAKVSVLRRMPPIKLEDILLGQYEGYRDDPTILDKDTQTPTYVAMRCWVETHAWRDVPFLLEAGKALDKTLCEIRLNLIGYTRVALVLRVQPDAGVYFEAGDNLVSIQGLQHDKNSVPWKSAYTQLLQSALLSQHEHFVQSEELLLAWKIFTPALKLIDSDRPEALLYRRGSEGPSTRNSFFRSMGMGKQWTPPRASL